MYKYYVSKTIRWLDGQTIRFMYGDKFKANRSFAHINNHEVVEEDSDVNALLHRPLTETQAKRLKNKMVKECENYDGIAKVSFDVKQYPEEISYDQFKAFICW